MRQTANTKPSWLYQILNVETNRAEALFCMQWAIEDEDFDLAMYHQLDYIFHDSEFLRLFDKMTYKQADAYFAFKLKAKGR